MMLFLCLCVAAVVTSASAQLVPSPSAPTSGFVQPHGASACLCSGAQMQCSLDDRGTNDTVLQCRLVDGPNPNSLFELPSTPALAGHYVPVDAGEAVASVTCGAEHVCALTKAGGVRCFGSNEYLQLGAPASLVSSVSVRLVTALDALGGGGVVAVSAGGTHTLVLLADGTVASFGRNSDGELGRDSPAPELGVGRVLSVRNVASLSAGTHHSCVVFADRPVARCWGSGADLRLGTDNLSDVGRSGATLMRDAIDVPMADVHAVAAGDRHTCVVHGAVRQQVSCFGGNIDGQASHALHMSPTVATSQAEPETRAGDSVYLVTAGERHTCAASTTAVVCWGYLGRRSLIGEISRDLQTVPGYGSSILMRDAEAVHMASGGANSPLFWKSGYLVPYFTAPLEQALVRTNREPTCVQPALGVAVACPAASTGCSTCKAVACEYCVPVAGAVGAPTEATCEHTCPALTSPLDTCDSDLVCPSVADGCDACRSSPGCEYCVGAADGLPYTCSRACGVHVASTTCRTNSPVPLGTNSPVPLDTNSPVPLDTNSPVTNADGRNPAFEALYAVAVALGGLLLLACALLACCLLVLLVVTNLRKRTTSTSTSTTTTTKSASRSARGTSMRRVPSRSRGVGGNNSSRSGSHRSTHNSTSSSSTLHLQRHGARTMQRRSSQFDNGGGGGGGGGSGSGRFDVAPMAAPPVGNHHYGPAPMDYANVPVGGGTAGGYGHMPVGDNQYVSAHRP